MSIATVTVNKDCQNTNTQVSVIWVFLLSEGIYLRFSKLRMAANVAWFRAAVDRIAVSDARRELLSELKVAQCGLSARDLSAIANVLPLAAIFDSVNTNEN